MDFEEFTEPLRSRNGGDRNWLKHTLAWQNGKGEVRLGDRPVHLHTLPNEVKAFPPVERVY
ncbi:MAG TPA: hypothetical protein VHT52_06670 [Stellaceae bacterium]|nr:hypothetical protein [Stellaceae bacterium]